MARKKGFGLSNARMQNALRPLAMMAFQAILASIFPCNIADAQDYLTQTGSPTFNSEI